MTSVLAAPPARRLRGRQQPNILSVPPYEVTAQGEDAIALCRQAGLRRDEWQQFVLTQGMAETRPGRWSSFEVATVPTWVGTIVTSTSVTIAALSYRASVKDKERDQASKVAAWIGVLHEGRERDRVLRISNGSDGSVFEVSARVDGVPREVFVLELLA